MARRVLLVEDQEAIREGVAEFLELRGYAVETYDSAGRALEHLRASPPPDLILLDLFLRSDMNGWQFASSIKSDAALRDIPVVAISGAPLEPQQLRQCEVDDFLPKPFELDDLLALVERHTRAEVSPPVH